jgi:hypothetical protein
MKKGLAFFLIIVSLVYLSSMYFLGKNSNKKVLSVSTFEESPTPIATIVPTQSPIPTEVPSPTPIPTRKPTPAPTITPATSEEVNGFIDRFAGQYGVDPNVIRYMALCESGFRSNAVSGAYVGLFQFGPITWQNIRAEIGEDTNINLRYSAEESVQTASYAFSKGKGKIWPNCIP